MKEAKQEETSRLAVLESENRRLRAAVEELSVLNEIASAVSSASSVDEVVDLIVQKCVKHLAAEQAAVLLLHEKEKASALHTMVRRVRSDAASAPYRLNDQLIGWMLKNQAPLVISDLRSDKRFQLGSSGSEGAIRSVMCVPLRLKGRIMGVLSAFNKQSADGFTESDQRLLTIIASQSAQIIENARLYEEEKALQFMQQELRLARDIQRRLLPAGPPSVAGYDIAGRSVPAQNVGGDYFDFIGRGGDELAVCLGDVSGKGVPAAVLMACVQATIRGQTLLGSSAGICLERSNKLLHGSTEADRFVTLFYALLDRKKHVLIYSNAGHNPPILLSHGKPPQFLTEGGPVLGVLPAVPFPEATTPLQPGDLLVIYSDGITEAMTAAGEEFGEEQLQETLSSCREEPSVKVIDALFTAVEKHCGGAAQHDDMTVVVVRRLD